MNNQQRLRIALQKTGRLSDESLILLKRCGIQFQKQNNSLFCHCENFPLDILLTRDDDIPDLVMNGVCDFGIVGSNVLQEKIIYRRYLVQETHVQEVMSLDFGKCRFSIAVPENFEYESLQDLSEKRIATSYPYLLQQFFQNQKIKAEIITLSGSVEIAPRLGIADAIADLVSTGSTLKANYLREVKEVFKSQAVLIKSFKKLEDKQREFSTLFISCIREVFSKKERILKRAVGCQND